LACLRYLAMKYKPEYYPVKDVAACGMIDFACDAFAGEVYPKIGPNVIYPVFGFGAAPADQAKANEEASLMVDTWMKHFVKGKFVNGDSLSIADFKAVPFFFACMQPSVESKSGFTLSDAAKQYTERFMAAVKSSEFLKSAGGFSVAEYAASKAEAAPIAVVAVDVDGDGKADFIVAGVDKDKDGIPDALEDALAEETAPDAATAGVLEAENPSGGGWCCA